MDEPFDYWDTKALNKRIRFQSGKGTKMPTPNFRRSDAEVRLWRSFTKERQQNLICYLPNARGRIEEVPGIYVSRGDKRNSNKRQKRQQHQSQREQQ